MSGFAAVATYVPHQAPMVLLDEVLQASANHMVCAYTVRRGAPFATANGIEAVVVLEYMAQTIAAFAGYEGAQLGLPPKVGYLLGCRTLKLTADYVPIGAHLRIEIRRLWGDSALGNFGCEVHDDNGLVAAAQLTVAQPGPGMALPGDA